MKLLKLGAILFIILGIVFQQKALANSDYKKIDITKSESSNNKSQNNNSKAQVANSQSDNNGNKDEKQLEVIKEEKLKEEQLKSKKDKLENDIKSYLGGNVNNIGLSYYDITSGEQININSDKTFLAASTVKIQLNIVLADMFKNGQASENEKLTYTSGDYEEGTGILQDMDRSKPYAITTLADYSIMHSDNIATNMLIRRIGYENFRTLVDKKLGYTTNHSDNYITAAQETNILTQLYENKDNNAYYSHIIDIMKNTDFHDRLDKYIDTKIVAHKIGNYSDYVNDAGIVYTDKPYAISIYTKGISNANEVIAHISKMVYDYQNEK
ncbi:MAG: serine hydrolase [Clostridium sp.]|uniref:serine hydrolase n=1 Tax=Clostridium sp. TaxID=1506 RepID=UPI0039EA451A